MKKSNSLFYVVTLGFLCAFAPMCSDLYLPSMPTIMKDFNTSPSLIQLSLTVSFLGLALGQIIIGPISDAYGRLRPLLASLAIFSLTSFLCAVADNIFFFVAVRFLQGLSASGGIVLTRSIACDRYRGSELTSFMSFLMAINSVAPILAPIIGSFVISFASWHVLFYLLVGWGIVLILMTLKFVSESHPKEKRDPNIIASFKLMKVELLNKRFMFATISLSAVMGGFFSYLAASPFIFQVIYGFTPFEYSLTFAFISLCLTFISILAGRIAKKFGELKTVCFAYVMMLVSAVVIMFIALSVPQSFIPVLAALAVFCSMMALSQAAGFGIVMSLKKGGSGSASGLFGVMCFLFGSLISPIVGVMGEKSMIPLGCNLIACVLVAMLLLKLAVGKKDE